MGGKERRPKDRTNGKKERPYEGMAQFRLEEGRRKEGKDDWEKRKDTWHNYDWERQRRKAKGREEEGEGKGREMNKKNKEEGMALLIDLSRLEKVRKEKRIEDKKAKEGRKKGSKGKEKEVEKQKERHSTRE